MFLSSQDGTMRVPVSGDLAARLNKALASDPNYTAQKRLFLPNGSVHVHQRSLSDFFRGQPKTGAYLSTTGGGHSKLMELNKDFTDFLVKKGIIDSKQAEKLAEQANKALISGKHFLTGTQSIKIKSNATEKAAGALKVVMMASIVSALGVYTGNRQGINKWVKDFAGKASAAADAVTSTAQEFGEVAKSTKINPDSPLGRLRGDRRSLLSILFRGGR